MRSLVMVRTGSSIIEDHSPSPWTIAVGEHRTAPLLLRLATHRHLVPQRALLALPRLELVQRWMLDLED